MGIYFSLPSPAAYLLCSFSSLLFVDVQVLLHVDQGFATGHGDPRVRVQDDSVLIHGSHVRVPSGLSLTETKEEQNDNQHFPLF